jgi:parvulin-like peptidyl-prolyl isomerase
MAMQRVRRLASAAMVAAVAVTGLSACRSAPDIAAYIDAGDITTAEVQRVYDDAKTKADAAAKTPAATPAPIDSTAPGDSLPLTQSAVFDTLLSHDVLMRLAQKHKVQIPSPLPLDAYAQILKLPASAEYVRLYVEVEGLQFALNQGGQGGPLTEADIRDIFERAKQQQLVDPASTPEQFSANLSADGKKVLGTAVALRNEAGTDISQQHIRLNPRFGSVEIPIFTQRDQQTGQAAVLVAQPVGDPGAEVPVQNVS